MSLFKELHRRNVFRVAALYLVLAWLVLKTTHVLIDHDTIQPWVRYLFEVILAVGLPLVVWFAWVWEITPNGLKKERDVEPDASITSLTGRKIDSAIFIVIILGVAVMLLN